VIKLCAAAACENSARVELEDRLIGLDGNGDRLLRNSVHERLLIIRCNVFETSHAALGDSYRATGSFASATSGGVPIAFLRADRIFLSIGKGIVHETSLAT